MLSEGGVGDVGGPRVPSVDEGCTAPLVPLDADTNSFSPGVEDSRVNMGWPPLEIWKRPP